MNSRSMMMIVVIGGLGLVGLLVAMLLGFGKLSEERKAVIKIALEVANTHQARDVAIVISPPFSDRQTLKISYETSVRPLSLDARTAEMEAVARLVWDRMEPVKRRTIRHAEVRRTWRSERGCFRRSDLATHEWTPPPSAGDRRR